MATPIPIISLVLVSGFETLVPSWPPASTWTSEPLAGCAAASTIASACGTERSPRAVDGTIVA
jgi:hypothetical protein